MFKAGRNHIFAKAAIVKVIRRRVLSRIISFIGLIACVLHT